MGGMKTAIGPVVSASVVLIDAEIAAVAAARVQAMRRRSAAPVKAEAAIIRAHTPGSGTVELITMRVAVNSPSAPVTLPSRRSNAATAPRNSVTV